MPGGQRQWSLYHSGVLSFSYPDPPVAEGQVHLAMLEHPGPRRVLLLGGALGGAVREVLKHPSVERVWCVELDPVVVRLVEENFPPDALSALRDRRVELVVSDGRAFLKRTDERFDVVLCSEGPPQTAQNNRFYTAEFFREVAEVLEPGGVFSFRVAAGHNYIPAEVGRLLASLKRTLVTAFAEVMVFPGATCTFLASRRPGSLTYDLMLLSQRMAERGVETSYVDASIWEADPRLLLLRGPALECAPEGQGAWCREEAAGPRAPPGLPPRQAVAGPERVPRPPGAPGVGRGPGVGEGARWRALVLHRLDWPDRDGGRVFGPPGLPGGLWLRLPLSGRAGGLVHGGAGSGGVGGGGVVPAWAGELGEDAGGAVGRLRIPTRPAGLPDVGDTRRTWLRAGTCGGGLQRGGAGGRIGRWATVPARRRAPRPGRALGGRALRLRPLWFLPWRAGRQFGDGAADWADGGVLGSQRVSCRRAVSARGP